MQAAFKRGLGRKKTPDLGEKRGQSRSLRWQPTDSLRIDAAQSHHNGMWAYSPPMTDDRNRRSVPTRPKRAVTPLLDSYWLECAVDATLLAKSLPTTQLKSEVAHIAAQFLKLAERDAVPARLLRKRQRR
jgi:hypothetical protein